MHQQTPRHIHKTILLIPAILFLTGCTSRDQSDKEKEKPSPVTDLPARQIERWEEDKLSLFIHFGVYASLAGSWDETKIDGPAEEIWAHANMFRDDYEKVARDFNPDKWDAENFADLARNMGTRTIILSAKHFDGFCLFDTETTRFNSVDFTPLDRDLTEEMAEACNNANIRLGIRFSLTDWHLPEAYSMAGHNANPVPEAHHRTNLQQIRELLTNYGPISEIHFHSGLNTPEQSRELHDLVKEIQPQCLISNGIGHDQGDFISTEFNQFPSHNIDAPWILPASLHPSTLGHHADLDREPALEVARKKVRELVSAISSGGNYALNIGPKEDGSISEYEEETLRHIGRWIKVNRKALFNSGKNPFSEDSPYWKATHNENNLYIFVDSVPDSDIIEIKGLNNEIEGARFLGSGIEPEFSNSEGNAHEITWTSPAMADPMGLPVIEVDLKDPVEIRRGETIEFHSEDTIKLVQEDANKKMSISGGDRFSSVPSVTGFGWNISTDTELNANLRFTEYEKDREILIRTNKTETNIELKGEEAGMIQNATDTLETGNIYRSKTFYGPLDKVHVNPFGNNRLQISKDSWMATGEKSGLEIPPLPMSSHYYYLEIESEVAQQSFYEITGNDGIQVWLNQEVINLSRNTEPGTPLKKQFVLDIEKGKNILLIKNYNRSGTQDHFALTPRHGSSWYSQKVVIPEGSRSIQITTKDHTDRHKDIDLPNLSVVLTQNQ